ncbi:DUF6776 family protein [Candidatus Rariloculus sp.]|uniref:DUF6776 family protein n=1 Tax=Candidatus Rariloculus sp. TaxID=3101265 RepID=UPI003D12B3AE
MTPRRVRERVLLYGVSILLIGAGGYLSYELGRYESGFTILDHRRQAEAFDQRIAEHEQTIEELRRQLAIFETSREINRETYAQVEADLGNLQAQLQASEEDLAFYRGIVSPQDGVVGLRIQNLEIQRSGPERHHMLSLLLVQAIVHSEEVKGTVQVMMSGNIGGEPAEFDLGQLVVNAGSDLLTYDFRYFQSFEEQLVLPDGFEPDIVEVSIRPTSPLGEPVTQRFQWSVVGS